MRIPCLTCRTPIDVTAVIWVYDAPMCVSCYMEYADTNLPESDEKIAESHEQSNVVGIAR